jgi:hypothetical protein
MPRLYDRADTLKEIANSLIPTYHPELATARFEYIWVDKAGAKGGKPVLGKIRKLSGSLEFLLQLDFLMEVPLDKWNDLTPVQRTALVDHLLERCWGAESEEEGDASIKWSVREPDVQEFSSILKRHGAWTEDLQGFTSVAKEIDIDGMVEDVLQGSSNQEQVLQNI